MNSLRCFTGLACAAAVLCAQAAPTATEAPAGTSPHKASKAAAPLPHPLDKVAGGDGAASPTLEITMSAELLLQQSVNGRIVQHLAPADHVVPGDLVIYTVEVRNASTGLVPLPQFSAPVPAHTSYVADTATGPGAAISYSVDGGLTFDKPENLRVQAPSGELRAALASDYTHIRWTLYHSLKPNSVVYARFHARLN